ncbi:MAG: hypothetical protein ACREFR_20015 [Limisphaerales bacterium]
MKIAKITIAGGLALIASVAVAQTQKGDWDVSVLGSFNSGWITSGSISTSSLKVYNGGAGLGYFLTDAWELDGNALVLGAVGGGANLNVVQLTLGANYNFNIQRLLPFTEGKTVPYVGAGLGGFIVGGGVTDVGSGHFGAVMGEGHAGVRQFLSQDVSLDFQVGYQYLPLPGVSLNDVTANIGLSFYF